MRQITKSLPYYKNIANYFSLVLAYKISLSISENEIV